MSDARLRELERRWRATGAVDDETRWLRERVRTGELPRDRLELAAHCGHEASIAVLGKPRPAFAEQSIELWAWTLTEWGEEAVYRAYAALLASEGNEPDWDEGLRDVDEFVAQIGYSFYAAQMALDADDESGTDPAKRLAAEAVIPWALGYSDPLPDRPWIRAAERLSKERLRPRRGRARGKEKVSRRLSTKKAARKKAAPKEKAAPKKKAPKRR